MSIKNRLGGVVATFDESQAPRVAADARARSAPVRLANFSRAFRDQEERLHELEALQGRPSEIPLERLVDSPFQVRPISEQAVVELAENLAENPLATPIVVRQLESGDYEIIAGHHRKRAYERLGRQAIPAIVVDFDADAAERALVFDNMVRAEMPDYYRYLSLSRLRDRREWSGREIAERTGLSKTLVYNLLAFERLPPQIHEVIDQNPGPFSSAVASAMGAALNAGRHGVDSVLDVAKRLAAAQITPTQAVAALSGAGKPIEQARREQPTTTYYDVAGGRVRLERRKASMTVALPASLAGDARIDAFNHRLAQLIQETFGPAKE